MPWVALPMKREEGAALHVTMSACPQPTVSLFLLAYRLGGVCRFFNSLGCLPALECLYLKGNPVAATTKGYRKTLICCFPLLTYLDDRPIFDKERRCAEAW